MTARASTNVVKALAVTCELTNTDITPEAATALCGELALYPEDQVLGALRRCYRELKSRLTLSDILDRLTDGRPKPEEAWSIAVRSVSESATIVWSTEIRQAWAIAFGLIREKQTVQARMAFIETYRDLCRAAREAHAPVVWEISPGSSPSERDAEILAAVEAGRLKRENVEGLLTHTDSTIVERLEKLTGKSVKMLEVPHGTSAV